MHICRSCGIFDEDHLDPELICCFQCDSEYGNCQEKIKIGIITVEKHEFGITIKASIECFAFSGFLHGNGESLESAIADLIANFFTIINRSEIVK